MHSSTIIITVLVLMLSVSSFDSLNTSPILLNTSQLSCGRQTYQHSVTRCVKWLCFNTSEAYDCCPIEHITCLENGPALAFGYCATYNETNSTKSLSIARCPYLQLNNYNLTAWHISLPLILTELNDYMCGPLNRKGLVCSECADGFGPSVTSYGYKCAKCKSAWYNIPLFIFSQLVPFTVLYIVILVFRIRAIQPPMPCFIMCAQFFVLGFDLATYSHNSLRYYSRDLIFTKNGDIRLDMKLIHTFYGLFSQLDVFKYLLPPLCLSHELKQMHVFFLGYFSVLNPIILILLTWVCVTLHGYNLRPLVWLWRPFHKCFVRLRREWDIKSDLVDAFVTFMLLFYTKNSYQAIVLLSSTAIKTTNQSGSIYKRYQLAIDPTIDFLGCTHLPIAITALVLFFVFNILPPLLLILYPFGPFRSCLSKCRLDFIAVNIFAEKIHRYYRNGLDGQKDMRSFSGLYFYFMIGEFLLATLVLNLVIHGKIILFFTGVISLIMALTVAITKPYKKNYMNIMDTLLLSCLALQNFALASRLFRITRMFLLTPIFTFFLIILLKTIMHFKKCPCNIKAKLCMCCVFFRFLATNKRIHTETDSSESAQPLIQPTSSEVGYGTCMDGVAQMQ